ncbi:MAG: hypothetical protein ACOYB3_07290 [Azonexus sp.]
MTIIAALAERNMGHVRAVFSERKRGHVAPADLLRAHLRAVALGVRLRVAFSDYLVIEPGPGLWSKHRGGHQSGIDALCVTGAKSPIEARNRDLTGGPLDAPECFPAGACNEVGYLFGGPSAQMVALREDWREEAQAPFTARRAFWRESVEVSSIGKSGPAGAHHARQSEFVAGFDDASLDAPEYMAAGDWRWIKYGRGYAVQRLDLRRAEKIAGPSAQMVALREDWREQVQEPFTARRAFWLNSVAVSGIGKSGPAGAHHARQSEFVAGFDDASLDAPEYMAAGASYWLECGRGYAVQRLALRRALQ